MPHLSGLQDAHAADGLTVIGVTAPDERGNTLEAVKDMSEKMSEEMRYHVAWDGEGKTWAAYMEAAGLGGIPVAFLVDGVGKLAYVGHPSTMDIPIAQVVAGTWDPVEGPKRIEAAYAVLGEVWRYTGGGLDEEQTAKVMKALATFEKDFPDFVKPMRSLVFALYLSVEHEAKVAEIGRAWLKDGVAHKDAAALNELAWAIVDPDTAFEKRDLALAQEAAAAAVKLSKGEDSAVLDTLARVHAWRGEWTQAIEVQKQAIAAAKKAKLEEGFVDELTWTLEDYLEEAGIEEETTEEVEEQ